MTGIEPLPSDDSMDDTDIRTYHKATKLRFSEKPLRVMLTWAKEDYERRGEGIDPLAATAQYELEKRIAKMDTFEVLLEKDEDFGLGIAIIGMGVGADAGMEKLGIFVKRVTEGGAAFRTRNLNIGDMICEVDGISLVGVTQAFAGDTLFQTGKNCKFLIAREKNGQESEIQDLIRQSLEMDRQEEDRIRQEEEQRALVERHFKQNGVGGVGNGFHGGDFEQEYMYDDSTGSTGKPISGKNAGDEDYSAQPISNSKSSNKPPHAIVA